VTVWLWQADGLLSGERGVSGDRDGACRAAEGLLLSKAATTAVVEEATTELGIQTLINGYWRTGKRWQARVGAGGQVQWVPVKRSAREKHA
jgi:hypothetical protein